MSNPSSLAYLSCKGCSRMVNEELQCSECGSDGCKTCLISFSRFPVSSSKSVLDSRFYCDDCSTEAQTSRRLAMIEKRKETARKKNKIMEGRGLHNKYTFDESRCDKGRLSLEYKCPFLPFINCEESYVQISQRESKETSNLRRC